MNFNNDTEKYIYHLGKLNRAFHKSFGFAPHKPILLLSLFELIRKGDISNNKIFITPELVITFKDNWKKLVHSGHTENFALPFFHLRSEPFWHLKSKTQFENFITNSKSIKSFKSLTENILYAEIDLSFFQLLQNTNDNVYFTNYLLDKYFPETKQQYNAETPSLYIEIEQQILNESTEVYVHQIKELESKLEETNFQEELFVRGGIFKKKVPEIYNHTCCISGLKIETTTDRTIQMIDACHIVPFSISRDDTLPNGISLCPNLHRAFDRGLITINKDFVVRVSPIVKENESTYSIRQFDGKPIQLPQSEKWYPSIEALKWHNGEVFKL
ncbi:HNH endonuclease [Flavobacterium sp. N1719]|uniref:HNH endonuclease n=1 Tax=Flavobacterium sp. N1719 TaxID=2885633 RepID=UPI002221FA97|nr:HNH endonuclease [Flavobacterium sp. N1719]